MEPVEPSTATLRVSVIAAHHARPGVVRGCGRRSVDQEDGSGEQLPRGGPEGPGHRGRGRAGPAERVGLERVVPAWRHGRRRVLHHRAAGHVDRQPHRQGRGPLPGRLRAVARARGRHLGAQQAQRLAALRPASRMSGPAVELEVGDRTVRISNPDRVYFPTRGETKLDLANYYIAVGDGIVRALRNRPCMLHRFPTGVTGEKVHQKRLPRGAPDWVETVRVHFPRWNRTADELCVQHVADVVWAVQMSTVEFHPWNSRRGHVEQPDEWRIDLDPMPGASYADVRRVAHVAHEVLDELGAVGYPKTSGGKGMHVYVRIEPRWGFQDVRRAAHA